MQTKFLCHKKSQNTPIFPVSYYSDCIFQPYLHYCASLQVLVLGAGYVSAPVVEYLTRDPSIGVTVAADLSEAAKSVASKYVRLR